MKRLAVITVVAALAGVGTWALATEVESPNQAAARAELADPVPVVAQLEFGSLQGAVSVSATAQRERVLQVTRASPASEVVTSVERAVGDVIAPGTALLRSNGRPVFVLPGEFPLYRDLQGGDSGDDVAQLQQGLQAAGYSVGRDRLGTFGSGTKDALREMYQAAGYVAPDADTREQVAALDAQLSGGSTDPNLVRERSVLLAQHGPRALLAELAIVPELPAVVEAMPRSERSSSRARPLRPSAQARSC